MSKQYKLIRCNINGKDVEKMVDVRASLTDMLRNDYHMTSVKKGCEVGECGACTVLIDGEAFNSCIYLAVWADGKHIRTLEGLLSPDGEPSDIQQAFMEEADAEVLKSNCLQKVAHNYSQHAVAMNYIEVYNQAMAYKNYSL